MKNFTQDASSARVLFGVVPRKRCSVQHPVRVVYLPFRQRERLRWDHGARRTAHTQTRTHTRLDGVLERVSPFPLRNFSFFFRSRRALSLCFLCHTTPTSAPLTYHRDPEVPSHLYRLEVFRRVVDGVRSRQARYVAALCALQCGVVEKKSVCLRGLEMAKHTVQNEQNATQTTRRRLELSRTINIRSPKRTTGGRKREQIVLRTNVPHATAHGGPERRGGRPR